ncbi:hypothetical protein K8I31_16555 [bacterium]|nr:hypothetical protein [bacterium]
MDVDKKIYDVVKNEVESLDDEAKIKFLSLFKEEVDMFNHHMAISISKWLGMLDKFSIDEKRQYVLALSYCALDLHIQSFKIFMLGLQIPSGNLQRQVVETIALALLCSGKDLPILEKFMEGNYQSNKSLKDINEYATSLYLKPESIEILKENRNHYHVFSHPTKMTLATQISFEKQGKEINLGANFEKGKTEQYKKEVVSRVNLSRNFENILDAISHNLSEWE